MKLLFNVSLLCCASFASSSNISWESEYSAILERFQDTNFYKQRYEKPHKFESRSRKLWRQLDSNKGVELDSDGNTWISLAKKDKLNNDILLQTKDLNFLQERMRVVNALKNMPYVNSIFSSKLETLILTLRDDPEIIIKIDGRSISSQFGKERSYLVNQRHISKVIRENPLAFTHLYLPYEYGKWWVEPELEIVFAKKIPFLSPFEIDNRAYLQLLLIAAERSNPLRTKITQMYEDMVKFVCMADFDDINYRNVLFADDGRLAPFDTDQGKAWTGVYSFSKLFFASEFLQKQDFERLIKAHCKNKTNETLVRVNDLFSPLEIESRDEEIRGNNIFLEEAYKFVTTNAKIDLTKDFFPKYLKEKQRANSRFSSGGIILDKNLLDPEENMSFVQSIKQFIKDYQANSKGRGQLLGQNCLHVANFVDALKFPFARIINEKEEIAREKAKSLPPSRENLDDESLDQAKKNKRLSEEQYNKAHEILDIMRQKGMVFSHLGEESFVPSSKLGNFKDLRAFICFPRSTRSL